MTAWWIAIGPYDHWITAFEYGKEKNKPSGTIGIWGVTEGGQAENRWAKVSKGDHLIFYASDPIAGAIGVGIVGDVFEDDKIRWNDEKSAKKVIYPLRFEFEVLKALPESIWQTGK